MDPLDTPPILAVRTLTCPTEDCLNFGVAITIECVATVICGACGEPITD
ncbi:hypothetical protein PBI_FLOOF_18 [Microbacterium phage Floof]|uniref:Uncharacterized protein n=1 Tax=Microbacterium phage Floof TaxID=2201433 RepID=A0A2Z4Q4K0_9CAUD|nr:hypothetical protein PBI_FLOOF_18 [Microbacterium phage Floof]